MNAIPGPPPVLEPTQDERTMATLAQGLSVLGFLPPLIIFFIKRESRFVSFHALQALLWHITYMVLMMIVVMVFFLGIMLTVFSQAENLKHGGPPTALFVIFPVIWLGISAGSIINIVLAVVYAIKAGQGEWADYPIFGRWARKILKMGPRGEVLYSQR
jgi:uncharacterized Tic20 family protein